MTSRPHEISQPADVHVRRLWSEHKGLALVLALFLIVGFTYSVTTPLFEASDELWHYPFVKRLADGGGLPIQLSGQIGAWRQEGSQPPLYYALGALLTAAIDTSDMPAVRWINPHVDIGVLTQDRNVNMVIHTDAERWPYSGVVLAVRLVRCLSLFLGAVAVLAGYLLAKELAPDDDILALGAASFTAYNAMFLFITGSVNNDALVIPLSAIALWLMVRYVVGRPTPWQWLLLGVVLGMASIAKASGLGLLALVSITGALVAWRQRDWRELLVAGSMVALPVLAIGGWWYLRNWQLYRDPLGLNAFVAIVGPRHPVPSMRQLLAEWKGFVMSYWGFFGGLNVAAPGWIYWTLSALGGVGLLAAPLYVWRRIRAGSWPLERWLQLGLVALWPAIVLVSLIRWTLMTVASQGRLMFSAITALSLLMAMGLSSLVPRRRGLTLAGVGALMLGIAVALPFTTILPAYAAPPSLTGNEQATPSHSLNITFDDSIRLLGYDLPDAQVAPGDTVLLTVYWQCLERVPEDYSVFVHLLGQDEIILGQRDRYPGQGTYPTSLWLPGEVIVDTYAIEVPAAMLTPASLQVAIGMYRLEENMRLPAVDSDGERLGDRVMLAQMIVPERVADGIPNPVFFNLAREVALVGYSLDRTAAAPGETVQLTLYWRALRDLDRNYSVFAHLVGEGDRLWAQTDSWPRNGQSPTATWRKGQVVQDPYELAIAQDAPPGMFDLQVGMYDAEVTRLALLGEGGHALGTYITLGRLRILPAQDDVATGR